MLFYRSPIGILQIEATAEGLKELLFRDEEPETPHPEGKNKLEDETARQLDEYFAGKRTRFSLPLLPAGTTFQQKVWDQLTQIPYGSTTTYLDLANKLGDPKTLRAVGRANGQNPIPIIIPCHRVIGSNNQLVGYGGGIERKRWLLKHEGALLL